jgi:epoxyqueuosine reductase
MKRAKLPSMQRDAAVVLGNVGTADDVDVLTRATDDSGLPVRVHAAHALAVIARRSAPRSPARGADGDRAR